MRLIVTLLGELPFLWLGSVLTTFALKSLNVHPDVLFVLKKAMAVFCGNFYIFGISRWTCMKLSLINTDIELECLRSEKQSDVI